jgi:hypothetical protein
MAVWFDGFVYDLAEADLDNYLLLIQLPTALAGGC